MDNLKAILSSQAGQRIGSLSELIGWANLRKSVVCPSWRGFQRPRPAAFAIGMPGLVLYRMMLSGLYVYRSKRDLNPT